VLSRSVEDLFSCPKTQGNCKKRKADSDGSIIEGERVAGAGDNAGRDARGISDQREQVDGQKSCQTSQGCLASPSLGKCSLHDGDDYHKSENFRPEGKNWVGYSAMTDRQGQ